MSIAMHVFLSSQPLPTSLPISSTKLHLTHKPKKLNLLPNRRISPFLVRSGENGVSVAVDDKVEAREEVPAAPAAEVKSLGPNGASVAIEGVPKFADKRWVKGTWDLQQFKKDGTTDWDAVIDAEARRRKLLEDSPETSTNDDPVVFDTSIIPWWAWIKRYHLPEAELLNGRAAMIGFFMAYFIDSLTGVGLVDQMSNFFCKTLLLVAVAGVLLIRKNEDIEKVKKLLEETTFYDKQWQATWQDDNDKDASKE